MSTKNRAFALYFVFFIFFCALEVILRLSTLGSIPLVHIFSICFSSLFYAMIAQALIILFKKEIAIVASILYAFCISIIYGVQICYFGVFNTFVTFGTVLNGTGQAVKNFSNIIIESIKNKANVLALMVLILAVFSFIVWLIYRQSKNKAEEKSLTDYIIIFAKSFASVISAFVIYYTFLFCTIPFYNGAIYSYMQKKPVYETVLSLGALKSLSLDYKRMYSQGEMEFIEKSLNQIVSFLPFSKNEVDLVVPEKTQIDETQLYNILPIDFDSLLQDDADEIYHEIDAYFASITPDKKNQYTGLFKGKNLIYITAESFSHLAIREDLTPTLYKMMTQGFYFENFYNPYWEVSTTDCEYVNCIGLLPKSGTFSFKDSSKNSLPFALGNQFRKLGYTTKAYHNYLGSYYDRNLSHPNMGYDFSSMGEGYRETEVWPDSDHEMMKITLDDYIDKTPFHSYYMTISGHLPYNFWANAMAIKHQEEVAHLPHNEAIRAYFACTLELENAVTYLLEKLEEKGIAEDTVIVITPDHYPYGLTIGEMRELAGYHFDSTFGLYESVLIVYNPGQEPVVVDKICSSLDIIPTISNLFGLDYDSRLLMGHDIFCDTSPFVVFKCTNVVTDKMKYRSDTNKAIPQGDFELTEEEITLVKKTLADKVKYSALVLEKDYYRRIENHLLSKEEK